MFVSLLVPSIYDANTSYPVPPTGRMNHRRRPLTSTLPPYSRQLPPFLLEVTPYHPLVWFQGHHHQLRPAVSPCRPPGVPGARCFPSNQRGPRNPSGATTGRPQGAHVCCDACPEPTLMMSRPGCGYSRTGSCSSMFIKPISSGSAPWLTK